MDKILEGLYIGSYRDVGRVSEDFVVYDIRRWIPFDEFAELRIDAKLLDAIVMLIHNERQQMKNVLVHCQEGKERSPLVVAWYMCTYPEIYGIKDLTKAYEYIMERRSVFVRDCWVSWKEREDRDFFPRKKDGT